MHSAESPDTLSNACACPPRGVSFRAMPQGREWIVDAYDCPVNRIAGETGREALTSLFANVIRSVGLHPVGQAVWQLMSPAGAVTGMVALVESHLTCHSDPVSGFLSLNLLSNRTTLAPDFDGLLTRFVGARRVEVRVLDRGMHDRGMLDGGMLDRVVAPAAALAADAAAAS